MTREETKEFLVELVGIYPKFQMMQGTIDAWASRLTDCSPELARKLLDEWLESDDGKYAPQLDYFVRRKKPVKTNVVKSDEKIIYHIGLRAEDIPGDGTFIPQHIGKGCLYDQYGREYASLDTDLPYYYDEMGRICNGLGRVIQE